MLAARASGDAALTFPNEASLEARSRVRELFERAATGRGGIVIFGAGELGRRILSSARAAGIDVCAATDNNETRWNTDLEGVPVLPPAEAARRFGSSAVFVVGVYNASGVIAQLRRLGIAQPATYPQFFWQFGAHLRGISGLALPQTLFAREDDIRAAFELLADPASRREFAAQIAWRCTLDDALLGPPSPFGDMHFDRGVYALSGRETLVDCGAFDGDSLRTFLARTEGSFEHAYALEPDPHNRAKLEASVERLPDSQRSAVTVLPFAASDRNGTVRFDAGHGVGSSASEAGALKVTCRRLDDAIERAPTLIKMDIEGAEPQALAGAARLVRDHRPVLAICAYHHCEHLWELPRLMRELAPDFRIVLRRYAQQCWETVYYAVPPERYAAG